MVRIAIVMIGVLLAGCATVKNGTTQDVAVLTTPAGASCTLSNESGHWKLVTPGTVRVTRSSSALEVVCTAAGYKGLVQSFAATAKRGREYGYDDRNPNYIDLPFVVVDAATGANRFYPDKIELVLTPVP